MTETDPETPDEAEGSSRPDPVRRWTGIVSGLLILLLALQIASDRTAPITGIGTVEGLVLPIVPRVSGELARVEVQDDATVEPDALLAEIDPTPFRLAVEAAEADLARVRLQAVPRTAPVGLLLQGFVIVVPLLMQRSGEALAAASGAFALNGVLAIGGVYVAFALFPGQGSVAGIAPAAAAGGAAERTRDAAIAALVMLPAFVLLLTLEAATAMRILFTVATVLVSLNRRDLRETGIESVLSALLAGAVALAFAVLAAFWPAPAAELLIAALLGLLVVPHAFEGRHRGAVALAVPLVWVLLGTASDSTIAKTLEWCLYSLVGVAYAVWARALLVRLLGVRPAAV